MGMNLREQLRDAVKRNDAMAYGKLVDRLYDKGVMYHDIVDLTCRAVSPDEFTAANYESLIMEYNFLNATDPLARMR
jgi:hypothetical protein